METVTYHFGAEDFRVYTISNAFIDELIGVMLFAIDGGMQSKSVRHPIEKAEEDFYNLNTTSGKVFDDVVSNLAMRPCFRQGAGISRVSGTIENLGTWAM